MKLLEIDNSQMQGSKRLGKISRLALWLIAGTLITTGCAPNLTEPFQNPDVVESVGNQIECPDILVKPDLLASSPFVLLSKKPPHCLVEMADEKVLVLYPGAGIDGTGNAYALWIVATAPKTNLYQIDLIAKEPAPADLNSIVNFGIELIHGHRLTIQAKGSVKYSV